MYRPTPGARAAIRLPRLAVGRARATHAVALTPTIDRVTVALGMEKTVSSRVLVVEEQVRVGRQLLRALSRCVEVTWATTAREACDALAGFDDLAGAWLDVQLSDGCGIEVVARLRAAFPDAVVVVATAILEPDYVNRAHQLDAYYLVKPFADDHIQRFLRRLETRPTPVDDLHRRADELAYRTGLDQRGRRILHLRLDGHSREEIAIALHISENTLKKYIRRILDCTGHDHLNEVCRALRELRPPDRALATR